MLIRRKESTTGDGPSAPEPTLTPPSEKSPGQGKKGAPTPRRREQEAARRQPLVPADRSAAKVAARQARRESQQRARAALETGDERYLPLRDRGPQRRFVRDIVDGRTGIGEFVMILAVGIFAVTLVIPASSAIQLTIYAVFWMVMLVVIVDSYLLGRRLRRALTERFGAPERGVCWYGVMRSLQLRKMRLPRPQVPRGHRPSS